MENLVGQHDTVLAIKEELPVLVMTKEEHENEEQQHSKYMETTESNLYIKSEEIDINLEEIDYESINAIKKEYLGSEIEGDFNGLDNLKQEGMDIDENQIGLKNEANIEAEQTALPSSPVAVHSSNPEEGRSLVHQSTLETITFETYPRVSKHTPNQGKQKSQKNKKSRKALFKCEQCSYEARCISRIHSHMRIHKDPSELYMYECTHCDFKTKHKWSLKTHSILHKDAADIPRYICNSCDFESIRKGALRIHIRGVHQKVSGMNIQKPGILKCEQCNYACNKFTRLLSHMLVHKDPSELYMYECTHCDFKTKYKCSLKLHSILHKDAADVPRYKCNFCSFENKRKAGLIAHIRSHKKVSGMCIREPGALKCEQCFYTSNIPSRLLSHMRVHKDPSELDMYECTQCNFKTKYKYSLIGHSILHKKAADIPRFKCNSCDFETSRKGPLIKHIKRRHKHKP